MNERTQDLQIGKVFVEASLAPCEKKKKATKMFLAFDPIISLLGIYAMKITEKEIRTICKKMFTAACS